MSDLTETACNFLESLQRLDLSMLLRHCQASIEEVDVGTWEIDILEDAVVVRAPKLIADAMKALPHEDRKRIAEAVSSLHWKTFDKITVLADHAAAVRGAPALLAELLIQRAVMISVATGGERIQDVNDYYRAREVRIRQTLPQGVAYENPYEDLWAWYHYWSEHFGQYRERRQHVRQLFGAAIEAIAKQSSLPSEPREATGWERVDRALAKARDQLELAKAEEDFQAIGLICREVIISLAQAVYDPQIHESLDGVTPSETDANRMLEAYIGHVFPGASYKELRAHARASLALALNLQHRRTATRQLAALCVEATASTSAVVSIISRAHSN